MRCTPQLGRRLFLNRSDALDTVNTDRETARAGLAYAFAAYGLWGFLPLYFLLIKHVGAVEVVAQRIIWSLILLVPLVAVLGRLAVLRAALANRRLLGLLALSAALIAGNWLVYVWGVLNGHVLATSFGYFLNPLVNVALGMLVLKERLTRGQGIAVAIAGVAVAILAVRAADGLWISLVLACSFGLYGLVRKVAPVESIEGLTIETGVLLLPSFAYLGWLSSHGGLAFASDASTTALLMLAGIATSVPLLLFAAAARRLRYSTLGLLQYLAPSIQFVLAITVFGEPLSRLQLGCFGLIWLACLVYAWSSLAEHRRLAPTRPQ